MTRNATPATLSQGSLQVRPNSANQYPSLDPSLIAAFLTEFDIKQQKQLTQLHETLASLCSPVDDNQSLSSVFEKSSLTSASSASDVFNDSSSSPTSSSNNSLASFSTPLGFLQNLFPDIDSKTLQSTLDEHGADNLEPIIDILLSDDLIRDLQERGGWTESDHTGKQLQTLTSESVEEWAKITKAQRDAAPSNSTISGKPKPKAKRKGKQQPSFVLGVVRHGQLPPHSSKSIYFPSSTEVDPWTYIDSVATRLNAILPNVPTSTFSSSFHNPEYSTPAKALRATLAKLGNTNTVDDFALGALVSLLDDESGDFFDANLCLRATASQPDDAYHLIEILKELDEKVPVIAHYTAPATESSTRKNPNLPGAPPETSFPLSRRHNTASEVLESPFSPAKPVWGTVPVHPKAKAVGAPCSQAVPISGPSDWTTAVGVNRVEQSGIDENDPDACMEVAVYWKEKRHMVVIAYYEALHWIYEYPSRPSNKLLKPIPGKTRDYATKEREWRLKAAKAGVKAKTSSKAIDLHGLTVHESLEVVKEGVNIWWSSAGSGTLCDRCSRELEPLQIITGRGVHSRGNVPVIAPAVMKLLERDGWRAHKREGIVYVTGVLFKR
ncbi:Smr domain-containing protein [Rhizoctonia solani AG-1 IA]|uniref:Smr domain-containing protein n=1 Tax=Thanatephorus cucumeris (strain AG1-IA) TaxID=983506 RepID=L8WS78_THACA|nr:Smr domain-containing protein [Rhizoctonia solani AG-1 IA]